MSTALLWSPADLRPPFLFAYMRWSATRSASSGLRTFSSKRTVPCELPIVNPPPRSVSASTAASIVAALLAPEASTQNSSPPSR